jgi:Carboxypeptidase regulatory-like domain
MKNYIKTSLLTALMAIAVVFQFACQKEVSGDVFTPNPPGAAETVKASVEGLVTDESGLPVQGAVVVAGGTTIASDKNGYFRFSNISLVKNAGVVKVSKNGYFEGARTFVAIAGRKNFVRIQLIPKAVAGTFSAASGGTATLPNGLKVTLPANGVVNAATNAAYSGSVTVYAAWLDPTAPKLSEFMPGDLRGKDASGADKILATYGMMAVELAGSGGEKLQIASGKKADLTFPLPAALSGAAPASIPLWFFDDATGLWKEEGSATKTGSTYQGQVSHFSFWNCDVPANYIIFSATFNTVDALPLAHTGVRIVSASSGTGYGITDSAGYVSGAVPVNQPLVLQVLDPCGSVVFTQNIGPYSANATIGPITVIPVGSVIANISGTVVNCSNQPVTNGNVYIISGNPIRSVIAINNGNFSGSIMNCGTDPVSIFAADNVALQQGAPIQYSIVSGNNAIGQLQACGTSIQQFIQYTVDGTLNTITSADSLQAFYSLANGIGNTYVNGSNITNNLFISFQSQPSSAAPGVYPLFTLSFRTSGGVGGANGSMQLINPINITFTEYGAVGQFVAGSFSGVVRDVAANVNRTINVNFRVRRVI